MDYLKEIIKGILIGVANIIPGVSGGTLAVSMGIYDKIIHSVTHLVSEPKESIKTLIPYGIGAVFGIIGLSFAIEFLFREYPLQTSAAFTGLILGGIPSILKRIDRKKLSWTGLLAFLVTFFLIVGMTFAGNGTGRTADLEFGIVTLISLFAVGMVAAATMVIPGVSGSMLLMMMGYYQPIIQAINRFILAALALDIEGIFRECLILAPFGLGVLAGIFVCAKLIEWLLEKAETMTYCGILGLVLSSPFVILSGIPAEYTGIPGILMGIVFFVLAFWGVTKL